MSTKEELFSKDCINYFELYIKDKTDFVKRENIDYVVENFYNRLEIPLRSSIKNQILDPKTFFLEVAHDGQIPHLGIVRLVLKTYHISTLNPNSLVLYFIGDHYSADMCGESTLFGLPQMGVSPNKQKRPIVFKIGRKNQHIPLKWLQVPSNEMIDFVEHNVIDWVVNNISYEKKKGIKITDIDKIYINFERIISILRENAKIVDNYGDWIIRVQYMLFKELMGDEIDKIIFLPFSDMIKIADKEYFYVLKETKKINSIKKEVSKKQAESGLIPYQKTGISEDTICFWLYCPNCKRRTRPQKSPDEIISFKCRFCDTEIKDTINDLRDIVMPDIVAFENAYFRLGIGGWVIGSNAPYQEVIAEVYEHLYGIPMPPRFLLKSIPVFRGIGDPEEGYGRTTLMRALIESSGKNLFESLMAPWDENPHIESEFLKNRG